jgi:hypothetical protein
MYEIKDQGRRFLKNFAADPRYARARHAAVAALARYLQAAGRQLVTRDTQRLLEPAYRSCGSALKAED